MDRKKLIEFEHAGNKYSIVSPTQEQLLNMDMEYRQAFSKAVREGLMTEFEAKRVFEKNGTWTDENETEITGLQMKIVALEMDLDKVEKDSKGREMAFEIMNLRNKLMDLINFKSRLFSAQTVEGYADAIKLSALTYECTVDEKGDRVFPTKESFCAHHDTEFTAICYSRAMIADIGMTEEDLAPKFSERTWLEEKGYIEGTGEFTTKYYEDLVGEKTPEEDKKPTKKVAKKTTKKSAKKVGKKTAKKRKTKKKVE